MSNFSFGTKQSIAICGIYTYTWAVFSPTHCIQLHNYLYLKLLIHKIYRLCILTDTWSSR